MVNLNYNNKLKRLLKIAKIMKLKVTSSGLLKLRDKLITGNISTNEVTKALNECFEKEAL